MKYYTKMFTICTIEWAKTYEVLSKVLFITSLYECFLKSINTNISTRYSISDWFIRDKLHFSIMRVHSALMDLVGYISGFPTEQFVLSGAHSTKKIHYRDMMKKSFRSLIEFAISFPQLSNINQELLYF